eukprot:Nitzschia sp. Nitz4//scaffold51_size120721//57813//58114//NITZ4_003728-RA/size120721-snap-gene-0.38-mRNA-1//-1//CDS//3329553865//8152//frame0
MTAAPSEPQGSWTPFVLLLLGFILWWAFYSQSPQAVKFRRWYNLQLFVKRVQWKKKLGLRDESIYKNGAAGDGANQRTKRQG